MLNVLKELVQKPVWLAALIPLTSGIMLMATTPNKPVPLLLWRITGVVFIGCGLALVLILVAAPLVLSII